MKTWMAHRKQAHFERGHLKLVFVLPKPAFVEHLVEQESLEALDESVPVVSAFFRWNSFSQFPISLSYQPSV